MKNTRRAKHTSLCHEMLVDVPAHWICVYWRTFHRVILSQVCDSLFRSRLAVVESWLLRLQASEFHWIVWTSAAAAASHFLRAAKIEFCDYGGAHARTRSTHSSKIISPTLKIWVTICAPPPDTFPFAVKCFERIKRGEHARTRGRRAAIIIIDIRRPWDLFVLRTRISFDNAMGGWKGLAMWVQNYFHFCRPLII